MQAQRDAAEQPAEPRQPYQRPSHLVLISGLYTVCIWSPASVILVLEQFVVGADVEAKNHASLRLRTRANH